MPKNLLFAYFSKEFYSIDRRKMESTLLAYGLPKETVTAIMMLYKNTKVKIRSLDGDTLTLLLVFCKGIH